MASSSTPDNPYILPQGGFFPGSRFGVHPMDAQARRKVVGDRTGRGDAAVDELNGDGLSVWDGLQAILNQDGGVEETVGCARVDKGLNGDGRLTWDQQMHQEAEVVR